MIRWVYSVFILISSTYARQLAPTVFQFDLDKYDIVVWAAPTGEASSVATETMRVGWEVGINGTFFCPPEREYQRCRQPNDLGRPIGNVTSSERIINGVDISRYRDDTGERWIIGLDRNGLPLFVQNNISMPGYMGNSNADRRGDFHVWLGNFPILVDNGFVLRTSIAHLVNEAKFRSAARRAFLCIPRDEKSLIWWYTPPMPLLDVGEFINREYGCHRAINLDAGASSALWYRGSHLVWPGTRNVVDGLIARPKDRWLEQMLTEYRLTTDDVRMIREIIEFFWRMRKTQQLEIPVLVERIHEAEQRIENRSQIQKRVILRELARILDQRQGSGTMFRQP